MNLRKIKFIKLTQEKRIILKKNVYTVTVPISRSELYYKWLDIDLNN